MSSIYNLGQEISFLFCIEMITILGNTNHYITKSPWAPEIPPNITYHKALKRLYEHVGLSKHSLVTYHKFLHGTQQARKSRPLLARQRNAIRMVFRWWANCCPTLDASWGMCCPIEFLLADWKIFRQSCYIVQCLFSYFFLCSVWFTVQ